MHIRSSFIICSRMANALALPDTIFISFPSVTRFLVEWLFQNSEFQPSFPSSFAILKEPPLIPLTSGGLGPLLLSLAHCLRVNVQIERPSIIHDVLDLNRLRDFWRRSPCFPQPSINLCLSCLIHFLVFTILAHLT